MLPQVPGPSQNPLTHQWSEEEETAPSQSPTLTPVTHTGRRSLQELDEAYNAEGKPPAKVTRSKEKTLPVLSQLTGNVARWLTKPPEEWRRSDAHHTIELVKKGYFKSDVTGDKAVSTYLEHLRQMLGDEKFVEVLRLFSCDDIGKACSRLFTHHYGKRKTINSLLDLKIALSYLSSASGHSGIKKEALFNALVAKLQKETHGIEHYYYSWRAKQPLPQGFKVENLGLSTADLFRLFSEPYFETLRNYPQLNLPLWWHLLKCPPEELFAIPQWKTILMNYVSCITSYQDLSQEHKETLKLWIGKALEEEQALLRKDTTVSLPSPEMRTVLHHAREWSDFAALWQKGVPFQGNFDRKSCDWLADLWCVCPDVDQRSVIVGNCSEAPKLTRTERQFLAHFLPNLLKFPPLSIEDLIHEPSGYKRMAILALFLKHSPNFSNTLTLGQMNLLPNSQGNRNEVASSHVELYFSVLANKLLKVSQIDPGVFELTFRWVYHSLAQNSKPFWMTLHRIASERPQLLFNLNDFFVASSQATTPSLRVWALATWAQLLKGLPDYERSENIRISNYHSNTTPRDHLTQNLNEIMTHITPIPDEDFELACETFIQLDRFFGTDLYSRIKRKLP